MSASGWACDGPRALWGTFRGPGTVFRARDPPLDGGPPARQSMGRRRSARLVCAGRCRRCCCSGPRESLLSVHLGLTDYCSSIPTHRGPGISATGTTSGPGVAREAPGTLCPPGTLKFPLTERGGPCRGMAQSPVLVIGPLLFFFFFFFQEHRTRRSFRGFRRSCTRLRRFYRRSRPFMLLPHHAVMIE